jgi:hypothetical protein
MQPQLAYVQTQGIFTQQQGAYGQQVQQPVLYQLQVPILLNDPARDAIVL